MLKIVKSDPRNTAVDVKIFANEHLGVDIGIHTARQYLHWSKKQWANVLWSDESKFNLFDSDGIKYVRRPPKQRFSPKYQLPTVKHGGGSIMVWGKK